MEARFQVGRIDHGQAYGLDDIYYNRAESYFLQVRPAEIGHHHQIARPYLVRYLPECAWRYDYRRFSNGAQVKAVTTLAMGAPTSVD